MGIFIQGLNKNIIFSRTEILGFAILSVLVALVFHILRAIGLSKLAKKQKLKNTWLAWIPFMWIYVACKLVGETKLFGIEFYKFALPCLIFFSIYGLVNFVYNLIIYAPLALYLLQGGELYFSLTGMSEGFASYSLSTCFFVDASSMVVYPYSNMSLIISILNYTNVVTNIFSIIEIVVTVSLYINIFRKYWPKQFILASLLSIFVGLFPVFIFVVRNHAPAKYVTVVRVPYETINKEQEKYREEQDKDSPFSEFSKTKGEDPFAEFFDDNKDKDE